MWIHAALTLSLACGSFALGDTTWQVNIHTAQFPSRKAIRRLDTTYTLTESRQPYEVRYFLVSTPANNRTATLTTADEPYQEPDKGALF